MNKITFILIALITGTSFAQITETATANVSADLVSVITIAKTVDLNFGKIISDANGGTVIIDKATNARTGTATAVTTGATPTAAKFTIAAEAGYSYSIGYVESPTLSDGGGNTMGVTYDHSLLATGNVGGTDTELLIGGTLTVGATQAIGVYAGTVVVTVAYE